MRALLIILVVLAAAHNLPASGFDRALIADARATVVLLRGDSGSCSGVVIAPQKIVTARHCVDSDPLLVVERDGVSLGVREWTLSDTTDVAVGHVPSLACPCAPLAPFASVTVDEPVAAIGFPYTMTQVATYGAVQPRIRERPDVLVSTARVAVGASGGGLFARRGRRLALVGVLSATSRDGSITWAVDHQQEIR